MKLFISTKKTEVLVLMLTLILLIPGYYGNSWNAAGKKWFVDWQKFHEHFVVARLVQSRSDGMFSEGALLGYGDITTWDLDGNVIDHEYELFTNGGHFESYWAYKSVPGIQAIPFSLFDHILSLAPSTELKLFRALEAALTAFVMGLFLVWVLGEFGLVATIVSLTFLVTSEWLTLFGANFYWNLWAFYIPFIGLCIYLQHSIGLRQIRKRDLFLLMTISLLIKCLFNGFEFISTALVMPFTALVYYAYLRRWRFTTFFTYSLTLALGSLTGTFVALGVLALQIKAVVGDWAGAFQFIFHTLGKRSFGDSGQYAGIEADSLKSSLSGVFQTYLNGRAINLNSILKINYPHFEFNYLQIFYLFALFIILFFLKDRMLGGFRQPRTAYALLVATCFSAFAPLSWFVIFKAHSYIHTQLNFILWQMPFTLMGFAFCGYVLSTFFQPKLVQKTSP